MFSNTNTSGKIASHRKDSWTKIDRKDHNGNRAKEIWTFWGVWMQESTSNSRGTSANADLIINIDAHIQFLGTALQAQVPSSWRRMEEKKKPAILN